MSNRFDFLKPPSGGGDRDQTNQGDRPAPQTPDQPVAIPGLEPKPDTAVPVERLNVEIPADLHQQLKEYCTHNKRTKKEVITALIEFLLANQG